MYRKSKARDEDKGILQILLIRLILIQTSCCNLFLISDFISRIDPFVKYFNRFFLKHLCWF
jgi:hypothetical protein